MKIFYLRPLACLCLLKEAANTCGWRDLKSWSAAVTVLELFNLVWYKALCFWVKGSLVIVGRGAPGGVLAYCDSIYHKCKLLATVLIYLISGWGGKGGANEASTNKLQETVVPIVQTTFCLERMDENENVNESLILCAGGVETGPCKVICQKSFCLKW